MKTKRFSPNQKIQIVELKESLMRFLNEGVLTADEVKSVQPAFELFCELEYQI